MSAIVAPIDYERRDETDHWPPLNGLARHSGLGQGWRRGTTSEQRQEIGRRLIALREELVGRGPSKIEPNRSDEATSGVADEDAQALSEMLQVLASQRNAGQADMLARITRAGERLARDPDGFGFCEDCEEEIPFARLEVLPFATLCAACQAKLDPPRNVRRRSTTDFS